MRDSAGWCSRCGAQRASSLVRVRVRLGDRVRVRVRARVGVGVGVRVIPILWCSQSKMGPYGRSTVRKAPRLVRVRVRGACYG